MSYSEMILFLAEKFSWQLALNGVVKNEKQYKEHIDWNSTPVKWEEFLKLKDQYEVECQINECEQKREFEYPSSCRLVKALFMKKAFNENKLFKECKEQIEEVRKKYPMPEGTEGQEDEENKGMDHGNSKQRDKK